MRFKFLNIFIAMLVIFMAGACSRSSAVEVGAAAPDFTAGDVDGKTTKLSDFKGKVVILNFFATWCPPCRSEIPDFIALQKMYGAEGLAIVGVSREAAPDVKDFIGTFGINYTVLLDSKAAASETYGPIRGVPTTFIIDKDFKIRQIYIGARPKEVFEAAVKELLK